MAINIVDRDKLDAALTATASAIRAKTGGSASIAFDMATDLGFKNAVDAIPTGGGDSAADGIIDRTISGAYTNSNVSSIGSYAFASCSFLTEVSFPVCTTIGNYAFTSCSFLTEVSFPVCTTIGNYAFAYCASLTSLTEVSFPVCANIGSSAFRTCSSLTEVNFPACTTIGSNAFTFCPSLTEVSFPVCANIGSFAFNGCNRLLSLYLLGSFIPTLRGAVFDGTPISNYTTETGGVYGSIIVKESMLSKFKSATNWSIYSSRFSVWNGVD